MGYSKNSNKMEIYREKLVFFLKKLGIKAKTKVRRQEVTKIKGEIKF